MTRLKESDIDHIAWQLETYDAHLMRMTGASLRQIACQGAGVDEFLIVDVLDQIRFAAVPVSSGRGVIGGFSRTVAAIVSHLGFESFVTESSDATGISEGIEKEVDILMLADDERFVALTRGEHQVADNARATALGFVAGLELMKGGLTDESVLVLGCGPVGVAAATALIDRGANVTICDVQQERAVAALREIGLYAPDKARMEDAHLSALERYELIFDATNAGSFIETTHLTTHTMVAAPGMPCALTQEAMTKHRDRILHDSLEIGTATMAVQAAAYLEARVESKKAKRQ